MRRVLFNWDDLFVRVRRGLLVMSRLLSRFVLMLLTRLFAIWARASM